MRNATLMYLLLTVGALAAACEQEHYVYDPALEVNDCFAYAPVTYRVGRDEISARNVTVIDSAECAGNLYRAYANIDYPEPYGADYPGEDAFWDFAWDTCEGTFGAWLERGGRPWGTEVQIHWIEPTEETWRKGDRLITCFFSTTYTVQ